MHEFHSFAYYIESALRLQIKFHNKYSQYVILDAVDVLISESLSHSFNS